MKDWQIISGDLDKFKENKAFECPTLTLVSTNPHCKVIAIVLRKFSHAITPTETQAESSDNQSYEFSTEFLFNCKDKQKFEEIDDDFNALLNIIDQVSGFNPKEEFFSIVNTSKFFSEDVILSDLFKFLDFDQEIIDFLKENLLFRVLTEKQNALYKNLQLAMDEEKQDIEKIQAICSEISEELNTDEVFYDIGNVFHENYQHDVAEQFLEQVSEDSPYTDKAHHALAHISLSKIDKLSRESKDKSNEKDIRSMKRKAIEHFMSYISRSECSMFYKQLMEYANIPLPKNPNNLDFFSNHASDYLVNLIFTLADSNFQLRKKNKKLVELKSDTKAEVLEVKSSEKQHSQTLTTYYQFTTEEQKEENPEELNLESTCQTMKNWHIISGELDTFKEDKEDFFSQLILESKNSQCKVNKFILQKNPTTSTEIYPESSDKTYAIQLLFNCKDKKNFKEIDSNFDQLLGVISGNVVKIKEFGPEEKIFIVTDTTKFFNKEFEELFNFLDFDQEIIDFLKETLLFRVLTEKQNALYENLQLTMGEEKPDIEKIQAIANEISKELATNEISYDKIFYDIGKKFYENDQYDYAKPFLTKIIKFSPCYDKANFVLAHITLSTLQKLKENNDTEENIRSVQREVIRYFLFSLIVPESFESMHRQVMEYANIPPNSELTKLSNDADDIKNSLINLILDLADSHFQLSKEIEKLRTLNSANKVEDTEKKVSEKDNSPPLTVYYQLKTEEPEGKQSELPSKTQKTNFGL